MKTRWVSMNKSLYYIVQEMKETKRKMRKINKTILIEIRCCHIPSNLWNGSSHGWISCPAHNAETISGNRESWKFRIPRKNPIKMFALRKQTREIQRTNRLLREMRSYFLHFGFTFFLSKSSFIENYDKYDNLYPICGPKIFGMAT